MHNDTLTTVVTAVTGVGGVALAGPVAHTVFTLEDIQHISSIVMQIAIGLVTIYRIIKNKKPKP